MMAKQIKLTDEQIILECRMCIDFHPELKKWCQRKDKREVGKHGKCLNKRKRKVSIL